MSRCLNILKLGISPLGRQAAMCRMLEFSPDAADGRTSATGRWPR
jgi:hypothetical protein